MPATPSRAPSSSGFVLLPIGIALTTIAPSLHGFVHGLFLGAGLALILLSVALLGASIGASRRKGQGWLPSRDGDG